MSIYPNGEHYKKDDTLKSEKRKKMENWYRIKRGFLRKSMLYATLDIKKLYLLTNGTRTPDVIDVITDFNRTLVHAIKRTHNRIEYKEDKKIEKRSKKNLAGKF